jgi:hypothetical protein
MAHGSAAHAGHPAPEATVRERCEGCWRLSFSATSHCLTGCAIGEVLGLAIATAAGWSAVPSIALAVVLAFFFGYLLALRPLLRAGLALGAAITAAIATDTVSIAVMEIIDNAIMLAMPGAMEAGLSDWFFWFSLAVALGVAFSVTWPVNYWLISRGVGHAQIHKYHR